MNLTRLAGNAPLKRQLELEKGKEEAAAFSVT